MGSGRASYVVEAVASSEQRGTGVSSGPRNHTAAKVDTVAKSARTMDRLHMLKREGNGFREQK